MTEKEHGRRSLKFWKGAHKLSKEENQTPQNEQNTQEEAQPQKEEPASEEKQTAAQAAEKEPGLTAQEAQKLRDELSKTQEELKKQKDLLLRTAAEYDNFRKRTAREKAAIYSDATAAAVLEFLPVSDNLARALEQKECSVQDLRKGIEMVQKQMGASLEKLSVTEMGAEGDAFDPQLHNAISHVEDEKAGENTVVCVYQKGYKIGDKIIRHAMVQVAN